VTPRNRPPFFNPQRRPNPEKNKPAAAAAIPHARRTGVQPKRERSDMRPTNVIWSCIDRVRRLDQKPKAGLIDLRMRVEIRSAKFLVADLTGENRGAYWEAGFAEGLGKKVYYTCEGSKFDRVKTHFDTEHLLTVKWTANNMAPALDELKSAIRNDFPTDAVQLDAA
jgi:nucleoside 2-deoxyribosyltransferase